MAFFCQKWKRWPRYKAFYIFFVIPLRWHFRHASPALTSIYFFCCFFTNNQPQIYLSVRKIFSKKFVFWYALMYIWIKTWKYWTDNKQGQSLGRGGGERGIRWGPAIRQSFTLFFCEASLSSRNLMDSQAHWLTSSLTHS